ncbi:MAG: hypothetical protein ACOX6W_00130 [Lentisphaeria bacterium]|jgi:hypothetical protein|nr:hypothetical protein [Lentisphaerota bacterium]
MTFRKVLSAALLLVCFVAGASELKHDGKLLFSSSVKASFGASYGERALKASVVMSAAGEVKLAVAKKPVRVFVDEELAKDWKTADGMVVLSLSEGTHQVQVRFDDMASLKPVACAIDLSISGRGYQLKGESYDENFTGGFSWPEENSGVYELTLEPQVGVLTVQGGAQMGGAASNRYFLETDSQLTYEVAAPGGVLPAVKIKFEKVGDLAAVRRVSREEALSKATTVPGALLIEGEAFARSIAGQVSISTEHPNTSGGGCVFNWGTIGNRLEWDVETKGGAYTIQFVMACMEQRALRDLQVNGKPVAEVVDIPGTGGWGRGKADEWRCYEPTTKDNKPLEVTLKDGKNSIGMTNLTGNHLNIDCMILIPSGR